MKIEIFWWKTSTLQMIVRQSDSLFQEIGSGNLKIHNNYLKLFAKFQRPVLVFCFTFELSMQR